MMLNRASDEPQSSLPPNHESSESDPCQPQVPSFIGAASRARPPTDERTARMVWSRLIEPGDHEAYAQLSEQGPINSLRQLLTVKNPTVSQERWRARMSRVDVGRDYRLMQRLGGRVLIPGDAQWPEALNHLGLQIPVCLWVWGAGDLAELTGRSVAVVGARACTTYGDCAAVDLTWGLVQAGVTVVSGGAYGIDAQAHRTAVRAQGRTVGVLAGGVDRLYPRGNEDLLRAITDRGCLVSEVPPGSAPTKWRFLERNRLIAAMAGATVVVEAGWRSGAIATANRALALGREVGAVPGPIDSMMSVGCHRLIRDGAACVTTADQVLELLEPWLEPDAETGAVGASESRSILDELDQLTRHVAQALPIRKYAPVESIAQMVGVLDRQALTALGRLDLLGLAETNGTGWRRMR